MESHASIDARGTEPQVIGRYALFDELAAGGMATVHVGRFVGHVGFSRIVAIKRLHPQFAKDPEFVAMFLDEARLASRIQHPNVVATLDVVKVLNEAFLVMEYVQGASLSRLLKASIERREKVPQEIAASIAANMLHGLHAAHEAKSEKREPLCIVHRDVSPQNVIVGVDGVARVLDFGIAKAAMRSQSTRDGQMKGKLSYMSPEQLNGHDVDRRTDVFAAGIVFWEALAGRRLFEGADAGQILAKVLSHPIPSPKQFVPDVSDALVEILKKALERDPEKRFQTARDFAIAIEDAIVFARPRAIGEWVHRLAATDLDRRAEVVARVESWSAAANRDAEFVTVMESSDDPEAGEATGLRARPSPLPRLEPESPSNVTKRERVATSPSQVGDRPSRERLTAPRARVATSPSQVASRSQQGLPPPKPPAKDESTARSAGATLPRPTAPLPPLVTNDPPRARVATSPSQIAARAAMLGALPPPAEAPRERVATSGNVAPRERVATSPSQVASRAAMLGTPPPMPEAPRERVATTPSQVAARAAMLGVPVPGSTSGEIARNMDRARVLTTPAKYRMNAAPPLPPGVEPRGVTPPPRMAAPVLPVLPAPPMADAQQAPEPEPRRKAPVPVWVIGAALALAVAVGAVAATRGSSTEKVSTPDFGASAAKATAEPRAAATAAPEPAPRATVPVVSPTDLPLEQPEAPPSGAVKSDPVKSDPAPAKSDPAPAKAARPKTAASSGCNPPYVIDSKGIKRLKPHCL